MMSHLLNHSPVINWVDKYIISYLKNDTVVLFPNIQIKALDINVAQCIFNDSSPSSP